MEKVNEKTIITQSAVSLNLLGNLAMELRNNPQKTIVEFFKDWQKSINWDQDQDYTILNQGVILTHLYGLIVYPKEIFHNEITKIKLNVIDKKTWGDFILQSLPTNKIKLLGDKKVIEDENELTLEFVIRKIRNSLSHGTVAIYENMDFIFNDEDGSKIYFTIEGIKKFINKLRECVISNKWE